MPDGRVEFEITADGRKAYASINDITAELRKAGGKWEKDAKESTDKIGDAFGGMMKKIAGAISAAAIGKALLNIGKEAIQAASDLEEVQNVVDVTFGEAGSVKIEKWAKNAAAQFGLTETQAKKFTSTLGAMMKSAGMSGDEITQISTDLSGLAADMASFYNLDFDTAFNKIRSGISGETEPLKQLGINMSEANLNAFALQQGLTKTFSQMSQGEKTILRYQYLMQATADAQGDFARTSDGFANAQRKLETNLETLKTNLGKYLLNPLNEGISLLNTLFEKLEGTGNKTVLDEFAEIDLKTGEKMAKIEATADKARTLTKVLDGIGETIQSNKTQAGKMLDDVPDGKSGNLKELKEQLSGLETQAVSNRKAVGEMGDDAPKEEKVNTFKAKLQGIESQAGSNRVAIKNMANDAPSGKNGNVTVLEGNLKKIETQAEANRTRISEMADDAPDGKTGKSRTIETFEGTLKNVQTQADEAKKSVGAMADNPPDASKLDPVKEAVEGIESSATNAQEAIANMTSPTEEAASQNALWLETCKELVKTLPGLNEIINTQTGEIKGGTQAVYDYIDAWEKSQKGIVLQSAHEQKRGALEAKAAQLPQYELDYTVAQYKAKQARDKIAELVPKNLTGETPEDVLYKLEHDVEYGSKVRYKDWTLTEEEQAWNDAIKAFEDAREKVSSAEDTYYTQKSAYDEAIKAYEEEGKIIEETYAKAIENTNEWTDAQKDAAKQVVASLEEALKAVEDYRAEVRKSVAETVDSNIGGFKEFKLAAKAAAEAANDYKTYAEALGDAALSEKEWESTVKGKNKQITAQSMTDALKSQLAYIDEYKKNLEDVKNTGLIDDKILAQLSDGSEESAQYLHAMAEAARSGDNQALEQLNDAWKAVNDGKETFVDALTQQKLAVDEQYDAMVKKAEEAAKALDVSGTAGESTGKNIAAIAESIKNHVPDVADQVDAVLSELNRLNGWGVNIDLGVFGSFGISTGNVVDGEYETGLDRVPFDGYLASLHEGEGILTAEENRVWQRFKNGQPNMDYDTLGGVMRDNIKPGGNVFLDGRVVGEVISQMQGNQYRTMQRSGWQQ